MRAHFQGGEIVPVNAAPPAVKSLPADAEVPASAGSVPSIEEIEKHPLKPRSCRAAQTLSEARQLARLGKLIPSDLAHPDTLQSVTNHSERAQTLTMTYYGGFLFPDEHQQKREDSLESSLSCCAPKG